VQHTATHCNTLQHTATHCNTPTSIRRFFKPSISFWRICTSSLTAKWSTFSTKCSCHLCDCDMTHSYVAWLIHQGHDWIIRVMTHLWSDFFLPTKCSCHLCDYGMTESYVTWLISFHMKGSCHVWNCDTTLSYLTQLIHKRHNSFMWLCSSSTSEINNINVLFVTAFLPWTTHIAACCRVLQRVAECCSVLQSVEACCGVLQCVAVCCSALQLSAVCCSVLQYVAVCHSVLQCVAVCYMCCSMSLPHTIHEIVHSKKKHGRRRSWIHNYDCLSVLVPIIHLLCSALFIGIKINQKCW